MARTEFQENEMIQLRRLVPTRRPRPGPPSYDGLIHSDCPVILLEILYVRQVLGLDVLMDVPPLLNTPALPAAHEVSSPLETQQLAEHCEAQWHGYLTSRASEGLVDRSAVQAASAGFSFGGELKEHMRDYVNRARLETLRAFRVKGPRDSAQLASRVGELFTDVHEPGLRLDLLPLAAKFAQHESGSHYYVHDLGHFLDD